MCEQCGSEYCARVVRALNFTWSWLLLHDGKEIEREDGFASRESAQADLDEFNEDMVAILQSRGVWGGGSAPWMHVVH